MQTIKIPKESKLPSLETLEKRGYISYIEMADNLHSLASDFERQANAANQIGRLCKVSIQLNYANYQK